MYCTQKLILLPMSCNSTYYLLYLFLYVFVSYTDLLVLFEKIKFGFWTDYIDAFKRSHTPGFFVDAR